MRLLILAGLLSILDCGVDIDDENVDPASAAEDAAGVPTDPVERERIRKHIQEMRERLMKDDDFDPVRCTLEHPCVIVL